MKIALIILIKLIFFVFNFGANGFSKKKWLGYAGDRAFDHPISYFFQFHFVVLFLFPVYWLIVGNIKVTGPGPINTVLVYVFPLFLFFGIYCKSLYVYFKGTHSLYVKGTNLTILLIIFLIHFIWLGWWATAPIYLDNLLMQILL